MNQAIKKVNQPNPRSHGASSAKKRVVITDKARVGVQERRGGVI